ncbi:MAG: hypothetical protein EOO50_13245 [Flavobacterium sp.]|uniref:hypothetical protein n=1 Tax=Flavobacterium sp. TaxID=239 RepID=UPI001224A4F8|nr:hypothetical protein [Flavobacterium sp.]RZJ65611.1 MAG: hypothetical protein EOO50_13245 [Flavobacterium sp.]
MKKSLFLYLFIIAVIMNVFTYAYFSKKEKSETARLEAQVKKANDSILVLYNKWDDEAYFSIEHNQNAQEYMEKYDVKTLVKKLTDDIMTLNGKEKGNPLVPYDQINAQKFIINKVKVINHRWIIADFSDGKVWGEVLLKYFIEADETVTFERIESQLYQPQTTAQ